MTLMKSWMTSENSADTPFALNNLPYGAFHWMAKMPVAAWRLAIC